MDDMKGKVKGFMKKVNNPFSSSSSSSSSGKFKGQGRVLGSSSSGPSNPILARPSPTQTQTPQPKPVPNSNPSSSSLNSKSSPQKTQSPAEQSNGSQFSNNPNPVRKPAEGFDPFDSLITAGKRSQNGYSLNVYECPICGQSFRSEAEVSEHVDSCVNHSAEDNREDGASGLPGNSQAESSQSELDICVGTFLSGKPAAGSVEVVLKLLKNIVREPENAKFRKIRMSNPKIRETIGEVAGGLEFLEIVGFELREEEGEMWAAMEVPSGELINIIKRAIDLLEPPNGKEPQKSKGPSAEASVGVVQKVEPKKIDRQIRVFFAVPENIAAKIVLPESFYNLSLDELKREADLRRKKIADSQLLIPKSYKEKQAKAARKKYNKAVIRIQFPDGVVLQGFFNPWEPTSSLYEFVSSALKEPSLEYDLLHPVLVKRRVIPQFPSAGQKLPTLDEEDLVPTALIKFRPVETDSIVFTGLCNELLEISEPLDVDSAVAPVNS